MPLSRGWWCGYVHRRHRRLWGRAPGAARQEAELTVTQRARSGRFKDFPISFDVFGVLGLLGDGVRPLHHRRKASQLSHVSLIAFRVDDRIPQKAPIYRQNATVAMELKQLQSQHTGLHPTRLVRAGGGVLDLTPARDQLSRVPIEGVAYLEANPGASFGAQETRLREFAPRGGVLRVRKSSAHGTPTCVRLCNLPMRLQLSPEDSGPRLGTFYQNPGHTCPIKYRGECPPEPRSASYRPACSRSGFQPMRIARATPTPCEGFFGGFPPRQTS